MKNKNQGITLIALVITIIVLLILAGITINAISGNEGVLDKAQSAKISTDVGNLKEEASLASMDYKVQTEKENDFEYYINKLNDVTKTKLALDTFYLERGEARITVNADGEIIEGKADVWDGTSVAPEIEEESKEIHIYTTKELKGLADLVNGGNNLEGYKIYLENDLDFGARAQNGEWNTEDNNQNRKWTPIAKEQANELKAEFYGKEHYIKGIYVNENTDYAGFIGFSGSVKDLTIKNSYMSGIGHLGAIAGKLMGTEIRNCHNKNTTINCNSTLDNGFIGGIVGLINANSYVYDSTNSGNIFANKDRVGGIVGHGNGTNKVIRCKNYGTVDGNGQVCYIGGIVGHINANGELNYCVNYGSVKNGKERVGGIAGNVPTKCAYSNNINYGNVDGQLYVGGIAGLVFSDINSCCNFGNITGNNMVGGIIGKITASGSETLTINTENCYNKANIKGDNYVGGIIGNVIDSYAQGTIKNNYNTGIVTAKSAEVGGIIGNIPTNAYTVTNNYTLQGRAPTSATAIEKTAEEMKTDTFVQLLGANNWTRVEGKNDGYPILKWEV